MRYVLTVALLLLFTVSYSQEWRYIEDGVAFTTVDKNIWVFRFDQESIHFNARGSNLNRKILPEWVKGTLGGINLNMFVAGNLPSGYTKIHGRVIQPKIGAYNAFIVWNSDTLMIMDRTVDSISEIMSYPNVSQNIRMVASSDKRNRWQIDDKKWSVAAIGTTTDGKVLFIHSRAPYQMHEFIDILLNTDELKLYRLAYLEGGMEASCIITGAFTNPLPFKRMGSYESNVNENDDNFLWYGLPWVIVATFK